MMKTTIVNRIISQKLNSVSTFFRSLIALLFLLSCAVPNDVVAQCAGDKEEPTIVCRTLRTTFMPDTCMVVVWAKDLLTSYLDDKTASEDLIVSFDPYGLEMSKTFFGEDGLEQTASVYVTDRCGKQTVCFTQVIINDNDGLCSPRVFDLALRKTISSTTQGPFVRGSEVTFDIEVINQGNVEAKNIDLTDYIPDGLTLSPSETNWVQTGTIATFNNAIALLGPDQSEVITISFTIDEDFEGTSITNLAEITDAENDEDLEDIDSDPDNNPDDDGTPIDDEVDNPDDEDDHDPADVKVDRFDLALKKTVSSVGPYVPGSEVTYSIEVINQGSIDATNVVIFDFVSSNMTNIDSDWIDDQITIAFLADSSSIVIPLTLRINDDFQGDSIINNAQIIAFENSGNFKDEDKIDTECEADVIAIGEVDDDIEDDYTGGVDNPDDADECDHAIVPVVQTFDLALRKTLSSDNPSLFFTGDTVSFDIEVFNQGTLDATRVDLVDYVPTGLTLIIENGWGAVNANNITRRNNIDVISGGTLKVGESVVVTIRFVIGTGITTIDNFAEIVFASNLLDIEDCDSTPDATNNDVFINDQIEDNEGPDDCDDLTVDEDDHDIETITVQRYDLAIAKSIISTGPYSQGSNVTFLITVTNEGTATATDIEVTDFPQATDLTFVSNTVNSNVTEVSDLVYTIGSLAAGEDETFELTFKISDTFQGTTIMNTVEITEDDGDDEDSDPDVRKDTEDGRDDDPDADDDEDMVMVPVDQRYDLAIEKTLTSTGPYAQDSLVTFSFTIENQGSLDAANISVQDFPQTGFDFVSSDETSNANVSRSGLVYTIASLPQGDTETISMIFRISSNFQGTSLMNVVEIVGDNGDDEDSDPDIRKDVDDGLDGTAIGDDDGLNGTDTFDDDEDMAMISVDQRYDLAIDKNITSAGPYAQDSLVTFSFTVENQGSLDAANVIVQDFPQTGLTFVSSNESGNANVTRAGLVYTIASLPENTTETISITFRISSDFQGTSLMNVVEIVGDNGDDSDSDPDVRKDTDDGLDGTVVGDDDGLNGTDTFDDDEDMVMITVDQRYDLAISKSIATSAPYDLDSLVTFRITVENQGSLDAANIEVTEFPDAGLIFVSNNVNLNANVSGSGSTLFTVFALAPQASESFEVTYRISDSFTGDTLMNRVEITADDGDDVDSNPDVRKDTDDGLDGTIVGDDDGLNGTDTFDDDEDMVILPIGQDYDLAIEKSITSTGPYGQDSIVTFSFTIENEGNIDAANVEVTDFPQTGLEFVSSDENSNANVSRVGLVYSIASLPIGAIETINMTFRISSDFQGTSLMNVVEITADDGDDVDSDPDVNKETDDGRDGTADGDDDDEDMEMIDVIQRYDLAIDKAITSSAPYAQDSTVTFSFTVENQGSLDAANVIVQDFPQTGLTFVSSDEVSNANVSRSGLVYTIASLPKGATETVNMVFQIDAAFQGTSLMNVVEITEDNGDDADSDPDVRKDTDDGLDGTTIGDDDGLNGTDTFDDDEDMEMIEVNQIYDLAIVKNTTSSGPYGPDSLVTFTFTVTNEGSLDASNVEVTDFPDTDLTFVSSNEGSNANVSRSGLVYTIASLPQGDSETISMTFIIDANFAGVSLMNIVEITADDGDDVDSDPDIDKSTDDGKDGVDDEIDDDEDMEMIEVIQPDLCVCPDEPYIGQMVVTCAGGAFGNEAVAAIIDVRTTSDAVLGDDWADPSTGGATAVNITKPSTWTIDELGQIFGTALNTNNGDIYFGATNVYAYDGDPYTPVGVGDGGEQGIYKTNFNSPAAYTSLVTTTNTFVADPVGTNVVPGKFLNTALTNNPLVTGWGNITLDKESETLFGTNLSDGRIYAIDANTGLIKQVYDPFGQASGFLSTPLPTNEALWGIELNECTRELFFVRQTIAGGGNVLASNGATKNKEIHAIAIDDNGVIDVNSRRLALTVSQGTREKITDIDFNTDCSRLILAERGRVHNSLTILFELQGASWVSLTDISVGSVDNSFDRNRGLNSTGGVSFGADQKDGTCDTLVWTMGDCLDPSLVPNITSNGNDCNVYGPQGNFIPEADISALTGNLNDNSIFIGIAPEASIDPRLFKFGLGDIELFNCCCVDLPSNTLLGDVEGEIISPNNFNIAGVDVTIATASFESNDMSGNDGEFAFKSLEMHEDYQITPSKLDSPISGVSTLDLILIQNHILGISALDNPYDIIAADINQSESINALDIVELRKILLGKTSDSPTNKAWTFVTSTNAFDNPNNPFPYERSYSFVDLEEDKMNSDFVGIKIGDVNGSYLSAESRSTEYGLIKVSKDEKDGYIDFSLDYNESLIGLQFAVELPYDVNILSVNSELLDLSSENYHIVDNYLYFSLNQESIDIVSKSFLFELETDGDFELSEMKLVTSFDSELYNKDYEVIKLVLGVDVSQEGYSLGTNRPNPFSMESEINFMLPVAQEVKFEFYSSNGELIHVKKGRFNKGVNSIKINKGELNFNSGAIIYKMITGEYSQTKKMILID